MDALKIWIPEFDHRDQEILADFSGICTGLGMFIHSQMMPVGIKN